MKHIDKHIRKGVLVHVQTHSSNRRRLQAICTGRCELDSNQRALVQVRFTGDRHPSLVLANNIRLPMWG